MPRPPPPDWTVESEEHHRFLAQSADAALRRCRIGTPLFNPWEVDTACRTRIAPRVARGTAAVAEVEPPRAVPIAAATRAPITLQVRPRVALGCFVALLSTSSLVLAFLQLYWMLEATAAGRALLDRMSGALTFVPGL